MAMNAQNDYKSNETWNMSATLHGEQQFGGGGGHEERSGYKLKG